MLAKKINTFYEFAIDEGTQLIPGIHIYILYIGT